MTVSIDEEVQLVIKDGPEGYSEDGINEQSEDEEFKAPYARSAGTRSESKAKEYRESDIGVGSPGSDGATIHPPAVLPKTPADPLALESSKFGSPFAYSAYEDKPDFFKGLLSISTRMLFDQVVAEVSTLRERLLTAGDLTNDGQNGRFCALTQNRIFSKYSHSNEGSSSANTKLQLFRFGPDTFTLELSEFGDHPSTAYIGEVDRDNDISDSSSSITNESFKAENTLSVRREANPETGELDYFVRNKGSNSILVNRVSVDPGVRAGPLPGFAVIDQANASIFWWRTPAALDYVPSLKRKRVFEEDNEKSVKKVSKHDTDPPSEPQLSPELRVFPDSKNWLHEYRRRFEICNNRPIRYPSSSTNFHPPHEIETEELQDADLILAIGAVWLGLIDVNYHFAYANSNLFSFARNTRMIGMHAVKGDNPFVIPLIFHEEMGAVDPESEDDTAEPLEPVFSAFQRGEEEKNQENPAAAEKAKQTDPGNGNKPPPSLEDEETQNSIHYGDIGHFVLAIAEKVDPDNSNASKDNLAKQALVRLRFMDSASGCVSRDVIRRVARNTVRNSGWLGDIWPCFDGNEEDWVKVLQRSRNRCGEHTVLNAWAYMLGIPLASTRGQKFSKSTYDGARRMIALALRGQLDSLTIRAWMQHYKYAAGESLSQLQQSQIENPGLSNSLRNMQTVALNEDTLNGIIRDMYMQEQDENQGHASEADAPSVTPNVAVANQSEHAHGVATKVTPPPSSQNQVPVFTSTDSISTDSDSPAQNIPQTQASDLPPETWSQSLAQSLAHHEASREQNPRTTKDTRKPATFIRFPWNMADYEVLLGIAPIWEGLKRLHRPDFDFTFAGMDVFAPTTDTHAPIGVSGQWSRFIMPLFFSHVKEEAIGNQGKGKKKIQSVGHLLLCVAELVGDRPLTVHFEIYDSSPGLVSLQEVYQEAQAIVIRSGWLGANASADEVRFRFPERRPVPRQVGYNTCGLHVILNAWAYMLGIPIHPFEYRRGRSEEDLLDNDDDLNFVHQGLLLVNLALEGFLDSITIQAYLNTHGYSAEQRIGDVVRAVVPVNAVGMNQDKFRRTLQARQYENGALDARARGIRFLDEDIAYLMAEGSMSSEQAHMALCHTAGRRLQALEWHFLLDPPADALSPKTPNRIRP